MLLTGGAGYLGAELAKGMASFGARVVVAGRTEASFEPLRAFQPEHRAGSIECVRCDVSNEPAFAGLVERVWKRHGRIDGLINHAASGGRESWEALDKAKWLEALDGSLHHYVTCTQIVGAYMLKAGHGSIVNTASIWGFMAPYPKMYLDLPVQPAAHTLAAKGAILQLTKYFAAYWGSKGIRVNAISPGWFPKKRGAARPDYIREITSRIPLERIGVPIDLVGSAVFLMSGASAYMTGQNVVVDGGYSIW